MNSTPFLLRAYNQFLGREQNVKGSFNALKILVSEHERIHAGWMFHHSQVSSIAAGESRTMLIDVHSANLIHLRSLDYQLGGGPAELHLYEDPYIDASSLGVGFLPHNLNRESSNMLASSFYVDTGFDVNSLGVLIDHAGIVESTGGGVKSIDGGLSSAVTEWNLKRGSRYLATFQNDNGSTLLFSKTVAMYNPLDQ